MFYMPPFLLISCSTSTAHHWGIQKFWEREEEGAGIVDALSALDLLLGRLVEWADGGGKKEGVVSATWHRW